MKILMVINCLKKGGRERRVLELVKGLSRQNGYTIYLLSLSDVVEYDYVYDLPISFEVMQKKSNKDISLIFKLRKIIRNFQPDIIHSWDVMSSGYLTAANLFLNKKIVNGVIYDAAIDSDYYNRNAFKVRLFSHLTKATVANSKAGLRAYKTPASKSVCIYNGIDLKRFDNLKSPSEVANQVLGRPKGDSFIGTMVASFNKWKDHDTLIKAAAKLCSYNKKVVFLLIGDGPEMLAIRKKVPASLLDTQIIFPGNRNDIESILQITDVGLLITPREGLSNAIIEYMASGKPVIASKGGGTEELVTDGENGYLVNQKSPDEIIEKMEILMQNPELAATMGCKGRQWIKDHFEISRMTTEYISLYKKLLNNHQVA
ncbi:MAG TPA: glycosyltransferase [Chitinophagaceae bacterium]